MLKSTLFLFQSERKKLVLLMVALVSLNLLLYIATINHDFLKDDYRLIVENPRVKDFQFFWNSLGSKFFAFPDFPYLHYWRPLSLFSFYLDYQLWGLNPSGYHLSNIIINAMNGLLLFLVFYLRFDKIHYAFLGALFFSIHPSHVEAVSWISGRTDLLSAFFTFAASLFFILFLKKRNVYFYGLTAFFFILGLLSKENAVLFPLLAIGLAVSHEDVGLARRGMKIFATKALRHQGTKNQPATGRLPFVSWCLGVLVANFMAVRNLIYPLDKGEPEGPAARGANEDPSIDSSNRSHHSAFIIHHSTRAWAFLVTLPFWIITGIYILLHNRFSGVEAVVTKFSLKDFFSIIKTIGVYTKVILTPFFPTPHFPMQMFDQNHLEFLVYFAAAVGILIFMLVHREKYKNSLYTLLFFIFLLPVLDPEIVPSYPKIVLRFAYIPALFAGIFAVDTFHFLKNKRLRNYYVGILAIIAVIWGVESHRFQVYFKDSYNHYHRLTPYYPEDCSLLLPLALLTAQDGDYAKALELVNRALAVNDKDRWLDISEMGGLLKANLLVISGDPERGKHLAERILGETRKDEMKYFGNLVLSKYYEKKGDLPAALVLLEKAGKIGETADLFFRTALVYAQMKNYPQALFYIEKAIVLNPVMEKYREFEHFLLGRQVR